MLGIHALHNTVHIETTRAQPKGHLGIWKLEVTKVAIKAQLTLTDFIT